jgi:hypothetical protein
MIPPRITIADGIDNGGGGSSSGGFTVGSAITGTCISGYVVYSNSGNIGCEALSGGGNVLNSGTPTNGQLALWTNATTIQGLTALPAANFPALTGNVTTTLGSLTTTLASIGSGNVTMSLGSDATGDIYYRNSSGYLTRLAIGSSTNVLTVSGGLPSWAAGGGGGGITVGSAITGTCPNGQVVYSNSGNIGCETLSGGGNVLSSGTPTSAQIAFWTNSNTIAGSTGITASNTALTATSAVTISGPDGGTWNTSGILLSAGTTTTPSLALGVPGTGFYDGTATTWGLAINGVKKFDYGITAGTVFTMQSSLVLGSGGSFQAAGSITAGSTGFFSWVSGGAFTSTGIGQVTFGTAASSSPVAQNTAAQSGSGTNISGQNWTIVGSLSTGTGTSGDVILQTGSSGAAATVLNTAATALTLKGVTQNALFGAQFVSKGYTVSTLPSGVTGGRAHVTDQLTTCAVPGAALTGGGSVICPVFYNGSAWVGG